MDHRHHVESVRDGVGVAYLLVSAVPLVVGVAQDSHGEVWMRLLMGATYLKGPVGGSVVDDQNLRLPPLKDRCWNSLQDCSERCFRVEGDDEDQQAALRRNFFCLARCHSGRWD